MSLQINVVEALWLLLNGVAVLYALGATMDSLREVSAIRAVPGNGRQAARLLIAKGGLRRHILRLLAQILLLTIVLPGLFVSGETPITPIVGTLIAVPAVLLTLSIFDRRDRHALLDLLIAQDAEDDAKAARETSVQENIGLTKEAIAGSQDAADKADAAFTEASDIHKKIAAVRVKIAAQEVTIAAQSVQMEEQAEQMTDHAERLDKQDDDMGGKEDKTDG